MAKSGQSKQIIENRTGDAFGVGLREASKKWKRPIRDWKAALNQFVILYGDRVLLNRNAAYTV